MQPPLLAWADPAASTPQAGACGCSTAQLFSYPLIAGKAPPPITPKITFFFASPSQQSIHGSFFCIFKRFRVLSTPEIQTKITPSLPTDRGVADAWRGGRRRGRIWHVTSCRSCPGWPVPQRRLQLSLTRPPQRAESRPPCCSAPSPKTFLRTLS